MRASELSAIVALSLLNPAHAAQTTSEPVRYVDAHSHLLPDVTPDAEVALFKQAGIGAVVIMHPEPEVLQSLARKYPGYVIPFISIARIATASGLHLDDNTAAAFAKLYDSGAVCGFGEMGTRLVPNPEPNDAAALRNRFRSKIYDVANARGAPLIIHVELSTPEVIEAFGQIAGSHPRMPLILAHAGWNAGPKVIEELLAAHPNIHVDLSVRLDPLIGFGNPPMPRPDGPNQLSLLTADGALQPEWRALLGRFSDRFMFAMDVTGTGETGRQKYIAELLADARSAFSVLPHEAREAIAHGNLEKLLSSCKAAHPGEPT